jgi:hypothetical protein
MRDRLTRWSLRLAPLILLLMAPCEKGGPGGIGY